MNIIKQLSNISHSPWYWLVYIVSGLTLLAAALYYQHVLDLPPCLLCIQVRLWISLLVIASFAGLLTRSNSAMNAVAHLSIMMIAVALIERSYQLLGTERGFVFGDCGFDLGMPAWFAIEEWLPWLYRVETSCGYTPEIIFGITMAEAMMALSVLLLPVSFCVFLASFVSTRNTNG